MAHNVFVSAAVCGVFTGAHSDHLLNSPLRDWEMLLQLEELSCAVSQRVLHVPVTVLHRISASQHPACWWTASECVCVCVFERVPAALRALCWFCSAVSLNHTAGLVGDPGFPSCCVYSVCLLPKKHSPIYYPALSLTLSLACIYHWLDSTCHFKSGADWKSGGTSVDSQRSSLPQQEAGLSFSLPQHHPACVIVLSFFLSFVLFCMWIVCKYRYVLSHMSLTQIGKSWYHPTTRQEACSI